MRVAPPVAVVAAGQNAESASQVQPAKIADHAVIGDGRSTALVSRTGAINWLCWPRFESPPLFGALLDPGRGGAWTIEPTRPARIARHYLDDTNVLETQFVTPDGRAVLTDVMAVCSESDKAHMLVPDHELIRRIVCHRGEIEFAVCCNLKPDFGGSRVRIKNLGRLGVRWEIGTHLITLRSDVTLVVDDGGAARALVRLRAGQAATFSLTHDQESPVVLPPIEGAEQSIDRSVAWWRHWIGRVTYVGRYGADVRRSALTLKLMSYAPSGAIVAAPTTSLPERLGGSLNWDYRFCWLRDAAFTARALLSLGYIEDAQAYVSWLLHTTRLTRPELLNVYDVYGNAPPHERSIGVRGYYGSQPVRTGCAIAEQLQLDTYGEVIDATAMLARATGWLDRETQLLLHDFGHYVCEHWRDRDAGIWEPRDALRHRTHSKVLCWVALDRLIELYSRGLIERIDIDHFCRERDEIREQIEALGFEPSIGAYTGAYGERELDASVLLMSWYGYAASDSPRMQSTYAALRKRLCPRPGLWYRYERSLDDREGAFWICSFWAVEHLALGGGSLGEALATFDAARAYANDVGLMAEEVDPDTREALGNFPQAYTHVGLINAALSLAARERRERGGR